MDYIKTKLPFGNQITDELFRLCTKILHRGKC